MTDRINLDELDAGEDGDDRPNPGDWFWREEGQPEDAPAATEVTSDAGSGTDTDESENGATPESASASSGPVPRVPRENEDKPAGIPMESGGSGAGASVDASASDEPATDAGSGTDAAGPHGGGADDMTLAVTYEAATRLDDFGRVAADATGWADWLGIVGDVPAHVLNKFQRDRNVDLDFFNGSARGPGERLAAIDRHSMFYAERMVVVGVEGEDEAVAAKADWEFVPLEEAAEKAGWDVSSDSTE